MRTRSKLVLAAFAAAALMAMAVGSASARSFSTSEQEFEVVWSRAFSAPRGPLTFTVPGFGTIECNVTLLGRFEARTIAKETGLDKGRINHAVVQGEACVGGTATVLAETLPWRVRYVSFRGTLPNITAARISLIGASFRVQPSGGIACLARTEASRPGLGEVTLSGGRVTGLTADETARIRVGGSFLCEIASVESTFRGIALVTNLAGTADLTITLI